MLVKWILSSGSFDSVNTQLLLLWGLPSSLLKLPAPSALFLLRLQPLWPRSPARTSGRGSSDQALGRILTSLALLYTCPAQLSFLTPLSCRVLPPRATPGQAAGRRGESSSHKTGEHCILVSSSAGPQCCSLAPHFPTWCSFLPVLSNLFKPQISKLLSPLGWWGQQVCHLFPVVPDNIVGTG